MANQIELTKRAESKYFELLETGMSREQAYEYAIKEVYGQ